MAILRHTGALTANEKKYCLGQSAWGIKSNDSGDRARLFLALGSFVIFNYIF